MTDTVIIYSSFAGKTRKIADYIAKNLGADIFDLKLQSKIDISAYKKVIIGTGVHAGNPYGKTTAFVEAHENEFLDKEVYLFVSCLYKDDRAAKQLDGICKDYNLRNAVYFSTRSEKNEAGLSKDVDAFIERMKA